MNYSASVSHVNAHTYIYMYISGSVVARFSYVGPYQIVKFAGTDQSQRALTGNRVIVRALYPRRKLARALAHRERIK